MYKVFLRSFIILLWVALLAGILYFPSFSFEKDRLNIFTWGDALLTSVVEDFEKSTGIKVNLNYYSSNEELMVKMKATEGRGYDLIIPSDYAVRAMLKEDLLQKIDHTKISYWNEINPNLLNQSYDPGNAYSIPFGYEICALGLDADSPYVNYTPSWKMVFDQEVINYKISMLNDPIEAIELTTFYLFGKTSSLNEEQIAQIKNLLLKQKKWVEAYADTREDYFIATKNCPVVVATSCFLQRAMLKFPFIRMAIPKEGTFISIENYCIPKHSQRQEAAYAFINYMSRKDIVLKHYQTYGLFPAIRHAEIDKETSKYLQDSNFKDFLFFQNVMPQKEIRELWLQVKTEQEP